jgi:hypothetical protein
MSEKTKPAVKSADVTPNDSTDILATRGIIVGGDGTLVVQMADGNDQTFPVIKAGLIYSLSVTKIYAATTATGIVVLW